MYIDITRSGHIIIREDAPCDAVIDFILNSGYSEEFILSRSFEPFHLADLMVAGFLIMSFRIEESGEYVLMPKHHITRSVLFFENLHIGRTVKRLLERYELRFDKDYDSIVEKCAAVHGDDWLTEPLRDALRGIRAAARLGARPVSFGLYRNGVLCAGEFGVVVGRVYTSYSGYYSESSAGRVQLILTARYLEKNNFAFWDLGMPLDYKYTIGAHDVPTGEFVRIFRASRN